MVEPLTFAIEVLLSKFISFLSDEVSLVWELKEELEQLQDKFTSIKDSIQPLETTKSGARKWLQQMREVAYDAEDVLDEFSYQMLRQKVETNSKPKTKVRRFFLKLSFPARCLKMAHKVRSINEKLLKLSDTGKNLGLLLEKIQQGGAIPSQKPFELPETHSLLNSSEMVIKRDEEVSDIVDYLLNSSNSSGALYVFSIVGMAGLGKTNLAKKVHQKLRKEKSFDFIIWICVSNTFEEKRILKEMLEYVDSRHAKQENMSLILESLKETLAGGCNCVLVTTRSVRVAEIMESGDQCHPRPLTDGECWNIIQYVAFGKESVPVDLVETGLKIAKKCFGLPLIANVVGGIMNQKKTMQNWQSILESEVWGLAKQSEDIHPILKLSFDRLPSASLKQCFAYCAIFPKDTAMYKDELVHQWISQGYFEENGKRSARNIGIEHFNYLAASSLLQVNAEDYSNAFDRRISCTMHDALHDLACSVSQLESWNFEEVHPDNVSSLRLLNIGEGREMLERIREKGSLQKIRALFIKVDACEAITWDLKGLRALEISEDRADQVGRSKYLKFLKIVRTYGDHTEGSKMLKSITKFYQLQCLICKHCRWLRDLQGIENLFNLTYLDISHSALEILPESIGSLSNLEVLDVSATSISSLPESIGRLFNLDTLSVRGTKIKCLPSSITKLGKLEIIDFRQCHHLKEFPKGVENLGSLKVMTFDDPKLTPAFIGRLTSLEVFPVFEVRNEDGYRIEELSLLNKLKGKLEIHGLENVRTRDEAMRANLKAKLGLHSLLFYFGTASEVINNEEILHGLEPPTNILNLTINGCRGKQVPEWLTYGASLCQLEYLGIRNAQFLKLEEVNKKGARDANSFSCLKSLELDEMECSEEWLLEDVLSTDFPVLAKLEIKECDELKGISGGFPSLLDMSINRCRKLRCLSNMSGVRSLQSLSIKECGITSLPTWLQECESLEELEIKDCEYCKIGRDFPTCSLSMIEVEIGPFAEECQEFPLSFLNAPCLRRRLEVIGWTGVKTLPSEIPMFTNLSVLIIREFEELEALPEWRDNFPSLEAFALQRCGKLKCLPSVQFMHRLKVVGIFECQELEGRCRENGTEWHKVCQIPRLDLGSKGIYSYGKLTWAA